MNRETLDRGCEWGILALVLAILVFGPLATGAVRPLEFLVIQALTIGVMALWGLRLWLNPRLRLLWPPICWGVLLFVVYAIWRYRTADIEYVGRHELIRVLVYTFLFLAILNNLHRQESTQIVGFTMIFLAMAISFYAVYQFLTGSNRVWWFTTPYQGRGCGTYICPNHLAGFLEMLLPLALAYVLVSRGKALTKILLAYAALAIVAGIGVTVSRGSWVACGLALMVFFGILATHRNYRLPSLLLMLVLIIGCGCFIAKTESFKNRFQKALVEANIEKDFRHPIWEATVRMWRDQAWFGVGPGHFDYRFRAYRPQEVQLRPDRAHNEYLNVLVDWGVTGTAIVAAALGTLLWGVLKTWKHVRKSENEFATNLSNKFAFVLGAAIGVLALLIHSAVDFNMQIPANAILAVSLMALLSGHVRFATDCFWIGTRLWLKILVSAVLLAGAAYLGYQEVRLGRESIRLEEVERLRNMSPIPAAELAAALERAFVAEPMNFETAWAAGEAYRIQCWTGPANYAELGSKAMKWYARGMALNRFDGYNYLHYGLCLDKLDRSDEAEAYFKRANELDPNGYFTALWIGWHYLQINDYAAARPWFERSLKLQWKDNSAASTYLQLVNARLLEGAMNRNSLRIP